MLFRKRGAVVSAFLDGVGAVVVVGAVVIVVVAVVVVVLVVVVVVENYAFVVAWEVCC